MIRAAQIQDISEILDVVHDSIRSCIKDHHRHESTIQIWLENKTQSNPIMWMHYNDSWVYVLNQHVVGFIMVSDQGRILLNYISSAEQQRGIGKALLETVIEHLKRKKIHQISLESTQTACSFYQKHGFQIHAQDIPNPKMVPMIKLLC
mgnify:FL=1